MKPLLKIVLMLTACLAPGAWMAWGQSAVSAAKPEIQIPPVSVAPKLADYMEGKRRGEELRITDFRQRDPHDGEPAISPTTAYLSYDAENIYAVFVCRSATGKVRAHLSRREDVEGDETVSVVLDTFHDARHAYEFIVNPLGVQMDGLITEGQEEDFNFDTIWRSEGRLTPDGYVVWIAIPFKSLRFAPGAGRSWGIALARYVPANNESSTWPHITKRVESYVPQFATLGAFGNEEPGHNLQFVPYLFASRQRFLNDAADVPGIERRNEFRGGMDAKYVLRNALTFDFTANPDFSQVESDDPQVTVNRRYEVFFPEKRPFFTESAGFFQTPQTLFFSRRIADPQWGTRMTGKLPDWTFGALAIDDRSPGQLLPGGDAMLGERAHIGVARVQRDFGKESTVGGFFSQYSFGDSSNRVLSLDARLKLNANWVVTAQAAHSSGRELDGTRGSGQSYLAEVMQVGRHLNFETKYEDLSPGFRADLGFIPRVDIRRVSNVTGYRWHPRQGAITSFGPSLHSLVDWDHTGQLQDWSLDLPFTLNLQGSTSITAGRLEVFERFAGLGFRQNATYAYFSSQYLRWAEVDASAVAGTNINYFPSNGIAPFLASSQDMSVGLTLRPGSSLRIAETYIFDRLGMLDGHGPAGGARAIFNSHLLRTKVSYQFTRAMSLRAIVDYDAVLANPSLVDLERSKRFNLDFLFTYMVHPGTALYVGYSDTYENLGLDPVSGLTRTGSAGFPTGRQVFVKLSYLFRM